MAAAASIAMLLAGCSTAQPQAETQPADQRPVVLTTFTVLADIASNVAGGHLRVESLTKLGAEIHGYEPTPDDLRRAAQADLIIDNGLNLEAWFAQFTAESAAPHVSVSGGVDVIDIVEGEGAGKPNPHAWMSPLNVKDYAARMADAFSELDPAHAQDYRSNAKNYQGQLQQVHDQLEARLQQIPAAQRVLVSCEGAFSYLARDAGLKEKYLWAVNAESQATPRRVASAIDYVRENQVPAVFCESTVSDAAMQRVVESTGATYGGTLYVDSLSAPDGPVPTYLDLIKTDTRLIADALTGAAR
ncbi:metal ABC transporter substrate-binding protein [Glutamicibacter uratoxydans]|uniref:metal ABC transporter substrate-binding protein n=2 Tax=Glutamicibacter uratoxydans TaxID=43667 RepID=UPI0011421189